MKHERTRAIRQPTDHAGYRAAVRHYLSRPDPVAFLAAADACEEATPGHDPERYAVAQSIWRKRGEWWPPLREALTDCLAFGRTRQVTLGGWSWAFIRRSVRQSGWEKATGVAPTRYVRVILSKPGEMVARREYKVLEVARERTYWTERILDMIDHTPDLTATGKGA